MGCFVDSLESVADIILIPLSAPQVSCVWEEVQGAMRGSLSVAKLVSPLYNGAHLPSN